VRVLRRAEEGVLGRKVVPLSYGEYFFRVFKGFFPDTS
jgi:hypothetical protein